ncbi:hypothetical protein THMIRHAS_06280 [Thiosulfatimonas sediminis]|uniref:Uncharacterized protein n=1 Tax=Thiosulfatimonas sediminis TaxID=2675054 RepID=A0A6F8PT12_9GAMM|nr:hypothetical protein [Thiosulfatimonas sediminis]BBP45255.1 hypothetical protein THMIRHAS_06280 [Thiosulfatimonas sediminis]
MKKFLPTMMLSIVLASSAAFADQETLDALVNSGVELTEEQKLKVLNASDTELSAIISQIVSEVKSNILAQAEGNADTKQAAIELAVQKIVQVIAEVKPLVVDNVASAISSSNPELSAVVAVASVEGQATAAGPNENANEVAEVAQDLNPGQNNENLPVDGTNTPGSTVVATAPSTGGAGGGTVSPN